MQSGVLWDLIVRVMWKRESVWRLKQLKTEEFSRVGRN